MDTFWIILTGSLVAACCALPGCFLLLRKMSMAGDAISHAVLPGIVVAYLFSGSRASLPMLTGAALTGLLATFIIELLHKKGRLQSDASIGISFTLLFSIGVILITGFADQVDLDQECVLYGEIAYVPLEVWLLEDGRSMGPVTIWLLAGNLLLLLAFIVFGYKGLFVTSFDPSYATALGISTTFWHYALMGAVSLTTVFSFEAVGAILVVAFLVGPPAVARLLTQNLREMLLLSVLAGVLAAIAGYYLAAWLDGSIAGAMAIAIGVEFVIALVWHLVQHNGKVVSLKDVPHSQPLPAENS